MFDTMSQVYETKGNGAMALICKVPPRVGPAFSRAPLPALGAKSPALIVE